MAEQTNSGVIDKPDEPLKEYGSIGDLGRYANLTLSLAFNFGFALFVGYVLGEMADDTFLGHYDGIFTWIGLAAGFVGAFFSTRKRLRRFAVKQADLFRRRERKLRGYRALNQTEIIVGFSACFAGVSRLCDLIYLEEFSRAGNAWILYLSLAAVGGGLLLLGLAVLLGKRQAWSPLRWFLLLPIPTGALLAWLGLQYGARPNVIVTMLLLAETPLIAFLEHLRGPASAKD
ncbi:MAG: hypothetical protein GF399_02925 [Candidatus Coatesbacteria bacterium]|nr:hypothetical protein [Candidatus Coatesbacteria bacterium]